MSRHQLQPTCAATAMCANVLRLSSAASHAPALPPHSRLAWATLGLCHVTSTGSGTVPNRLIMLSLSWVGSSAFGMRSTVVSSFGRLPVQHEDTAEPANVTTLGLTLQRRRRRSAFSTTLLEPHRAAP